MKHVSILNFFFNKEFMAPSRNATWVISEKSVTEYFQNPVQQNNIIVHEVAIDWRFLIECKSI